MCVRCQIVSFSDNSHQRPEKNVYNAITEKGAYKYTIWENVPIIDDLVTPRATSTVRYRRFSTKAESSFVNGLPGPRWINAAQYLRGRALLRSQKVLEGRPARLD
jgi:hypothetical protein